MRYIIGMFFSLLLLNSATDNTDEHKLSILQELHAVNKKRIELLKTENKVFKNKLAETRSLLQAGNVAKQTLIDELNSLQIKYAEFRICV